ncbi:MAG: ParA family protein [Hyphomicrobium sp.]|nr:ParA family protein [Hyphomicrobium sp.]
MPSNAIAVMNTKGGVGKSTLVLALAETLSAYHGKNVLVIDSDAQASVSSMLTSVANLHRLQSEGLTIVDYLVARVLQNANPDWSRVIIRDVGDVDDARSVFLIPSDMQLTLFEREVSREGMHSRLRSAIARLLDDVKSVFDLVLIDCPPGLSVLTECWLREADYHISPTRADYVSVCGLEVFRRFKALNPEMGFADNLGVVVNMKDPTSQTEEEYHRWLTENAENNCFSSVVPRTHVLQDAARFHTTDRSYFAKYPGYVGAAVRSLTEEILKRLDAANATELPAGTAAKAEAAPPISTPDPAVAAQASAPAAAGVEPKASEVAADEPPPAPGVNGVAAEPDLAAGIAEAIAAARKDQNTDEPEPLSAGVIQTIADAARGGAATEKEGAAAGPGPAPAKNGGSEPSAADMAPYEIDTHGGYGSRSSAI